MVFARAKKTGVRETTDSRLADLQGHDLAWPLTPRFTACSPLCTLTHLRWPPSTRPAGYSTTWHLATQTRRSLKRNSGTQKISETPTQPGRLLLYEPYISQGDVRELNRGCETRSTLLPKYSFEHATHRAVMLYESCGPLVEYVVQINNLFPDISL